MTALTQPTRPPVPSSTLTRQIVEQLITRERVESAYRTQIARAQPVHL